jgi:hypothetical protein
MRNDFKVLENIFRANALEIAQTQDTIYQTFGAGSFKISNNGGESFNFSDHHGYADDLLITSQKEEEKTKDILRGYKSVFKISDVWQDFFPTPSEDIKLAYRMNDEREIRLNANTTLVRDSAGAPLYINAAADAMCLNPDLPISYKKPEESIRQEAAASPLDLSKPETLKRVESAMAINEHGDVSDGQQCLAPVEGERLMQAKAALKETTAQTNTDPTVLKFKEDNLISYGQVADLSFAMAKLMDREQHVPELATPSGTSLPLEIRVPLFTNTQAFANAPVPQASAPGFVN